MNSGCPIYCSGQGYKYPNILRLLVYYATNRKPINLTLPRPKITKFTVYATVSFFLDMFFDRNPSKFQRNFAVSIKGVLVVFGEKSDSVFYRTHTPPLVYQLGVNTAGKSPDGGGIDQDCWTCRLLNDSANLFTHQR